MVIQSLKNSSPEDQARLFEILKMKTSDQKLIDEAIGIIKASGSIEYAKRRESEILVDAWKDLEGSIPKNKGRVKLKNIAEFFRTPKNIVKFCGAANNREQMTNIPRPSRATN